MACRRAPPPRGRAFRWRPVGAVDQRQVRTAGRRIRRHHLGGVALLLRGGALVRAGEVVGGGVGDRRHAGTARLERARRLVGRVPCGQRIHRPRQRIEIAPQPARAGDRLRVGGAVDVAGFEVRAAGVRVAGALHERQPPLVEDAAQRREPRMQAPSRAPRHRSPPAAPGPQARRSSAGGCSRSVLIGDQRVERVVAATQVDDDEPAPGNALRLRDVGQERGRREPEGDGGDTVTNEQSAGEVHGRPCLHQLVFGRRDQQPREPGGPGVTCDSLPVHAPPATR